MSAQDEPAAKKAREETHTAPAEAFAAVEVADAPGTGAAPVGKQQREVRAVDGAVAV